jgi:GNAT superfamily N-acetyltransferase
MQIRSLALTTELMIWQTRGQVIRRPAYWVVKTPTDPDYFFGNLLLIPQAPTAESVALWQARFVEEFPDTTIRHATLWWDQGELSNQARLALQSAGFTITTTAVLKRGPESIPVAERSIELSPLSLRQLHKDDVGQLTNLAMSLVDDMSPSYAAFLHRRSSWQAALISRGVAGFFGASDGEQSLRASVGVVVDRGLARFQDVQTAAAFRKQGLASGLIAMAHQWAAEKGAHDFVVFSEVDTAAQSLYQSLGFVVVEHTHNACRYPLPALPALSSC